MEPINVLSLFDGMSCGQIALKRAGIPVQNYYASEIDGFACSVSSRNFPKTVHVGDVAKLTCEELPRIDLLIGGSPCQGFSFAGGQLAFDDPRSVLFFEFVRILHKTKPKYFMLENVKMKKEFEAIITEKLGVAPVYINSAKFCAQNRERVYWTNIPLDPTPVELHREVLRDILDETVDVAARPFTQKVSRGRGVCKQVGVASDIKGLDSLKRVYSLEGKCPTLTTMQGGHRQPKVEYREGYRKLTPLECERLQTVPDGYTAGVSNTQRYKMLGNGWTVDVIAHIFKNIQEKEI